MWLRSEKRSSRIAQPNKRSTSIQLRKIIKNTPALKNLKQTTTQVTPSRRSGVYSATSISNASGKSYRNNVDPKPSPSTIKCNIKSRPNVKRLNKKIGNSHIRRSDRKKYETTAAGKVSDKHQCGRIRRRSLRNISEIGKENCWQDQAQLDVYAIENKRDQKAKAGAGCASANPDDNVDSAGNNTDNSDNVDTFNNISLAKDACDSCKPSTTCELNSSKNECVNYIECDSTTDNDQTNLPSTSVLVTVRSIWCWICLIFYFCFFFLIRRKPFPIPIFLRKIFLKKNFLFQFRFFS